MNRHHAQLATTLIGTLVAAGAGLALSPADAAASAASKVTAHASDRMPASGQTFRVSGNVSAQGHGAPATISVKTLRDGSWVPLTGASVHTDSTGHYSLRVVLDAKGQRRLRVVAAPDGGGIRTSRKTFSIAVGMPGNGACN